MKYVGNKFKNRPGSAVQSVYLVVVNGKEQNITGKHSKGIYERLKDFQAESFRAGCYGCWRTALTSDPQNKIRSPKAIFPGMVKGMIVLETSEKGVMLVHSSPEAHRTFSPSGKQPWEGPGEAA